MKLKCDKHGRRLIIGERLWAHRTGDQSKCDGNTASIGDTKISFNDAEFPERPEDPSKGLLRDIFADRNSISLDRFRD